MGEVFAGLRVVDDEVPLGPHHFGEVLKGHIGTCVGIIEPAVRVFLDNDRPALLVRVPSQLSFAPEPSTPSRSLLYAACLLYTSDAADDLLCVDLGGRRIIKKKKK